MGKYADFDFSGIDKIIKKAQEDKDENCELELRDELDEIGIEIYTLKITEMICVIGQLEIYSVSIAYDEVDEDGYSNLGLYVGCICMEWEE